MQHDYCWVGCNFIDLLDGATVVLLFEDFYSNNLLLCDKYDILLNSTIRWCCSRNSSFHIIE